MEPEPVHGSWWDFPNVLMCRRFGPRNMPLVIARVLPDSRPLTLTNSVNMHKLFAFCHLHYKSQCQHIKWSHFSAAARLADCPKSRWRFSVLLCRRAVTSDRWSMAARRLGSKSETSLAAAREMRIDNRMILNEGACQYIVRELTDLVKGEGRHGGWILAG